MDVEAHGMGAAAGATGGAGPGAPRPAWAPLALAVAVLSVSFAAPLFRLADAPPLTATFWRLALAVVLLLPFARNAWPTWLAWRREWLWVSAAGMALGAHFALWVTSLFLTTVAASVALVTLQAVFVALGAHWILGDRIGARGWLGVAVASVGAIVVALQDWSPDAWDRRAMAGNALAVAGGLGSAAYFLIGRRLRRDHGLVAYVTPVYAVAAVAVLVALLAVRQPLAGMGGQVFALFVLLAAVPMLGGHTLANWCLRHMEAHVVATWILFEPVGAALIAWALPQVAEVPTPATAIGGILVLLGAALTLRPLAPRQAAAQAALRPS